MTNERLLKKLRHWSVNRLHQPKMLDVEEFKRSVLADISHLYNTQKGTVLIDEQLGVPDFSGMMSNFGAQEILLIEKAFKNVTDKYEPRVRGTTVKFMPRDDDHGILRFHISGVLILEKHTQSIEFNALINGNGSVSIEL